MADIKRYVADQIREAVKKEYPHLRLPANMLAVVTAADSDGMYRLRILDQNMEVDETIPEIPGVTGVPGYRKGDVLCVALLYGQLWPYIIGRYAG